ncbi:hypothetical protein HDN1F_00150 [gamma proteobacterium HdN1]|nr:hypothetical protein HDN1F_00150 [gamma proteobacterium HdN1]
MARRKCHKIQRLLPSAVSISSFARRGLSMFAGKKYRALKLYAVLKVIAFTAVVCSTPAFSGDVVYTGVHADGSRWFSDTLPAAGVPYTTRQKPAITEPTVSDLATNELASSKATTKPVAAKLDTPDKEPSARASAKAHNEKPQVARSAIAEAKAEPKIVLHKPQPKPKSQPKPVAQNPVPAVGSNAKTAIVQQKPRQRRASSVRRERIYVSTLSEREVRRCERYDVGLRKISARLRESHSARAGVRLHARKRDLEDLRNTECRNRR